MDSRKNNSNLIHFCSTNNSIVSRRSLPQQKFDYLKFYKELCGTKGCRKVEISSIRVYHGHFWLKGYQITYEITSNDGHSMPIKVAGEIASIPFSKVDDDTQYTDFHLDDNEHIYGLEIEKGHKIFMSDITFLTNFGRRVRCSCLRKDLFQKDELVRLVPDPPHHQPKSTRTVAFSVTNTGIIGLGLGVNCYSEKRGWETVGHYVMLRRLRIKGRAVPRHHAKREKTDVTMSVMEELVHIPDDTFNHVLGFLL